MRFRKWRAALYAGASLTALCGASAEAQTTASTGVGELIITAPRQEVAARQVQLQAPNLISVRAIETILKYPDFNAAEALGRMPGVSLSSDTGEGRFVQIRGIDANLDGATYGGIPLLNTNPGGTAAGGGGRAVEFDTIPTGAIDGIIVTYTLLPDHEAEGLGGSIELTPRTAANVVNPFIDATLGWGYEPLHDHTGPFEADVAFGGRFGFGDNGLIVQNGADSGGPPRAGFFSNPTPFSFVLYGSRKDDRRAIDDLEEDYVDDGTAPSNAVSEYSLRRYDYHRRRFSFGGAFDFQPNEDYHFYIRANVAGYIESVHKNILDYENLNAVENTTGIGPAIPPDPNDANGYLVTTDPMIQSTNEEEVHRNQIYAVGGTDRWGDVVLDYHAAYSRATFHERHSIVAQFDGPTVPFTYDNVTTPNYPIFTFPNGTNVNDPSIYALSDLENEHDVDVDEEYSYAVNLQFPAVVFNDDGKIKIGTEVRLRDKVASEYDVVFGPLPNITLATPNYSSAALYYYENHYTTGPEVNSVAIQALENSGTVPEQTTFNQGSYIAANENIYAGYALYTGSIGPWGFLAGARVEATDADYGGYVASTDASGNTTNVLLFRPVSYVNIFPTVQLRYSFSPTMVLRATYSSGIGRPGFTQNTTAASVDFSQTPVVITRGNPNLKPTYGDNFDLSFEDYLNDGGIISLALFDKQFTNYIAERIQNGVVDPLSNGELANVTTFLNIPSAYARGVQADFHQRFIWLPGPFDGFGIEGNITLVDSRILEYAASQSLTGQNEYGLLPGTSRVTWNLAGFYEAYGIEARLAAEYVSASLFGLGGDKSLDTIQDRRLTLDWTSSYRFSRNWVMYFEAKNLLNTPLRYYEGEANRPLQREFYDVTFEGGVRASF